MHIGECYLNGTIEVYESTTFTKRSDQGFEVASEYPGRATSDKHETGLSLLKLA